MSDKRSSGAPGVDAELLYNLGMSRESWCTVERKKEQDWCRTQKRHHPEKFNTSTVFRQGDPADSEDRCTFTVNAPTHKEKRHFTRKNNLGLLNI
ncbi:protein SPATA45 homolog [Tubulanus polymorphus]|uniref:protein SPATA45 homolog n=1 Tax=Tubulanus polymorphus TaxID=672921 RepID=UPI003DA540DF